MTRAAGPAGALPVLSVNDLTVEIQAGGAWLAAVRGVSFALLPGRAFGLVGESGCGKSLTALAIARLLDEPRVRIGAGSMQLGDDDLASASEAQLQRIRGRDIGMVFQEPAAALNPVMRAGDQVGETLRLHLHLDRAAAATRAIELLGETGLPDPVACARAFPHQLSGGMKQRVLIAMAIACRPRLLIADEPTTALDVTVQAQILTLLDELRRKHDMALLLVSHDLGVIAQACEDVAVMYAGRIVERGPVDAVLAWPRHPYTRGLRDALAPPVTAAGHDRPRLREIPGNVPALSALPPGCGFADRCARALPACRDAVPPLAAAAAPEHEVRCLFPMQPDEPPSDPRPGEPYR